MGTTTGVSLSRLSFHSAELACGSRSITTARFPALSEATARCRERVVFPVPPFWLNMETMYIRPPCLDALLPAIRQIALLHCRSYSMRLVRKRENFAVLPFCLIAGNNCGRSLQLRNLSL